MIALALRHSRFHISFVSANPSVNGVNKASKTPLKSDWDPFLRPVTFCSPFEGQNS
ncbi:hypothetical protein YC2023_051309 [Brassica napus]